MKRLPIALMLTAAILTGCGKKDEPSAAAGEAAGTESKSLATQVEETVKAVAPEVKEAAKAVASTVDWSNLTWNDVSSVPYDDKDKLLQWASPQVDALKEQLSGAVKDKGMAGLASLGDSGWQGAIKKTVDALETVRTSSPETWELARGALISAWQTLQTEAAKYLE
jgi:hypothetical protein